MIHLNTKVADLIHADVFSLSILERLNIPLGFGDININELCDKHNLNKDLFIDILQLFLYGHLPERSIRTEENIPELVNYLKITHKYYLEIKIPQIENLINKIELLEIDRQQEINILKKFFENYKIEFYNHLENEEKIVFPYIIELFNLQNENELTTNTIEKISKYSISDFEKEHDNLEEKLNDLKNIIIKYLKPFKSREHIHQILILLFELEKDVYEHAQLEDLILVPIVQIIEQKIKTKTKK